MNMERYANDPVPMAADERIDTRERQPLCSITESKLRHEGVALINAMEAAVDACEACEAGEERLAERVRNLLNAALIKWARSAV